ncbi:hypothetical protein [Pseudoxanthomonas winnipegensis]|uniref:DUF3558 domain-containing protein n=1 Tax=Pseudoxanthomonas winnipegensis TaxID=2480810 RepID=A0A4Q8M0K4_9GAMM|nr:hypothetical protein [Pseudoxanthomonas winnipegensis]TAA38463.1 hypothetical protein EA655_16335 [Pseudoxanthomonas winnipegensis]
MCRKLAPSVYRLASLVLSIPLLAACSGASSAPAPAKAATSRVATHLAVKDCAGAAGLLRDVIQGMALVTDLPQEPDAALQCMWRDDAGAVPARMRSVSVAVYLGEQLAEDMYDAQTIALSGATRVAAPTIERAGGIAFSKRSSTAAGVGGQFDAQLPDAHVVLQDTRGAEAAAGPELSDASRVRIAGGLLGLN